MCSEERMPDDLIGVWTLESAENCSRDIRALKEALTVDISTYRRGTIVCSVSTVHRKPDRLRRTSEGAIYNVQAKCHDESDGNKGRAWAAKHEFEYGPGAAENTLFVGGDSKNGTGGALTGYYYRRCTL